MAENKPSKRAHNFKDLVGKKFALLTVDSFVAIIGRHAFWLCLCDCGVQKVVSSASLKTGNTKSCGCWKSIAISKAKSTHRMTKSPEYRSWQAAKNRCLNPSSEDYSAYGGRGIYVCPAWRNSFEQFLIDMGPRPKGTELDRIDNDGPYAPDNCRWATRKIQCRNKRTSVFIVHDGTRMTLPELSELTGIPYTTLKSRYLTGRPLLIKMRVTKKKPAVSGGLL